MLIVKTSVARILIFFFCTEPLTLPLCFNQFVAGNSQGLTLGLHVSIVPVLQLDLSRVPTQKRSQHLGNPVSSQHSLLIGNGLRVRELPGRQCVLKTLRSLLRLCRSGWKDSSM